MIIDFKEENGAELYPFTAILIQPFHAYTAWDIKATSFSLEWSGSS
jgi:hypothetical protein